MRCPIILALFLDLAVRAVATKCDAGSKHKADLAGLYCTTAATDAAACSGECCEKDKTTCGGLSVTCPSNQYHDDNAAWKKKAATEKTKLTACCTAKATCGDLTYKCPAGKKVEYTTFANTASKAWRAKKCPGGPNTCGEVCCVDDINKCGGSNLPDGGGKVYVKNEACTTAGLYKIVGTTAADDAWKNTNIEPKTDVTKTTGIQPSCCGVKAKCSSTLFTCPAGKKKDTTKSGDFCEKGVDTCVTGTVKCCIDDANTCGGQTTVTCGGNTYNPAADATKNGVSSKSWARKPTTSTTAAKDCCTTRATCKDAVCGAGYKKKAKVDALSCPNNRASCATTIGLCCEKDTNTCGGMTGITCAYGFFNEATTWITTGDASKQTKKAVMDAWKSRNTTAATKNTNCCTPRAVCEYEAPGTTTPAAVVTTTPAAPVRRYSEHMLAVKKGSDQPRSGNLVWLAVGGFLGMGVLMAVQGLRSRTSVPFASLE